MANLDQAPSRSMPNLLHVLPAFAGRVPLRGVKLEARIP
jgi:inorganic pyrophosphatase